MEVPLDEYESDLISNALCWGSMLGLEKMLSSSLECSWQQRIACLKGSKRVPCHFWRGTVLQVRTYQQNLTFAYLKLQQNPLLSIGLYVGAFWGNSLRHPFICVRGVVGRCFMLCCGLLLEDTRSWVHSLNFAPIPGASLTQTNMEPHTGLLVGYSEGT